MREQSDLRQASREEAHRCFMDLRAPKTVIHWRLRKPRRAFLRRAPSTGSSSSGATISSSESSSLEARPRFLPVICIATSLCFRRRVSEADLAWMHYGQRPAVQSMSRRNG